MADGRGAVGPAELAAAVRTGERRALARAITLIESSRADHRAAAEALLEALLPHAGKARRLGISGAPGVGKSSFIEAFGLELIEQGQRVAVLAVDPSSQLSGGSILGDRTRMQALSQRDEAFIRPSPAGGTLGGVARRTREAMIAVEAAGYDLVIVETVGVGQSETAVAGMVDIFLLLVQPGGGDELQGLKKGVMELADLILVNKADGELEAAARRAVAEYRSALHLLRPASPRWAPRVAACSALTGAGIAEAWGLVGDFYAALGEGLGGKRAGQARAWLWSELRESLAAALMENAEVRTLAPEVEAAVEAGTLTPGAGVRKLLEAFLGERC